MRSTVLNKGVLDYFKKLGRLLVFSPLLFFWIQYQQVQDHSEKKAGLRIWIDVQGEKLTEFLFYEFIHASPLPSTSYFYGL